MLWDLVIVGGGPAGLSTALFVSALAPRIGLRTLVLEKATYPREKICAGAIGDRAEKLLRAVDADLDVPSCPIRGFAVTTAHGTLTTRGDEVVGRVVRRRDFDAALADRVRARGVTLWEGVAASAVRTASNAVEIDVAGETVRTRALVGADGVGSFVRRALGLSRGRLVAQVSEVDTERDPTDVDDDVLHFDLRDGSVRGYAWDFPTPLGGAVRACRGIYDLRSAGGAREEGIDVSARLASRLGARSPLGPTRRFAERGIEWHEPMSRPRVLLAGEAAGIDPVLGEGIAQAVFYGKSVADYLVTRLASDALGFDDWRSHLKRTRVGLDLTVRARALPLVYDRGRGLLEHWVTASPSLARVGLDYFAGTHVGRAALARSAVDLGRAAARMGLERISRRWALRT